DPNDPSILYIGADGGGVWKTTNGGATWAPLLDSQPNLSIGCVAVAPSDPNVLYAGTGRLAQLDSGVYRSPDAGKTWELLGNGYFGFRWIGDIVVHPTDPNTVYAAVGNFGANSR